MNEKYCYEIGDIIDKKIQIIDRTIDENYIRQYKYLCLIDGNIDWTSERVIKNKKTICSVCSNKKVKVGVNDIPTTASWMIPYFQGGYEEAKQYVCQSNKKINPICPDCKKIKNKPMMICTLYRTHSIGCSCGDGKSYPNKFMYSFLSQLGEEFVDEYSPEWIGRYLYDFYIPRRKLIIEMDGGIGHGNKKFKSNSIDTEGLKRDQYKDIMANSNGIHVVRIDCKESNKDYIWNNIVNSKLFSNCELKKVDINICHQYALSNRVKYVCEMYEKNKPITPQELSKLLNMKLPTVSKYIRIGDGIFCDYDKEMSKEICIGKLRNYMVDTSKPVYMYDVHGSFYGKFKSAKYISDISSKKFGIYLNTTNISAVCVGKNKQYKGFVFSYDDNIDFNFRIKIKNRKVLCFDNDMNLLCKYNSLREASIITKVNESCISDCCRGKQKTAGGYIWKYADEVENRYNI